jgi:hypothetical protein
MTDEQKSALETIIRQRRRWKRSKIKQQANICPICQHQLRLRTKGLMAATIDHIKPLSRGGENATNNVQVVHSVCNTWKADRLMEELELPYKVAMTPEPIDTQERYWFQNEPISTVTGLSPAADPSPHTGDPRLPSAALSAVPGQA